MAQFRIDRNSITPKGFLRRVFDSGFDEVRDPREQTKTIHPLGAVLRLAVLALASGARSARAVEDRSEHLKPQVRAEIGIHERVSDNAFGLILGRLDGKEFRGALHRQVKAEWERKRLQAERLPQNTVAIDGKHLATISEKRLRALISHQTPLNGDELTAEQLRQVLGTQFPCVQLHESEGGRVYGLVRVHRATLISSDAAVVIDQWPLQGKTNEMGTIETTLKALFSVYGRTKMIEMLTLDAGNASASVAHLLRSRGVDYFLTLKSGQGRLHQRALEKLERLEGSEAVFTTCTEERGKTICYTVWRHLLDVDMGWKDAAEIVRVERVVAGDEEVTVGNRYFVTSDDEMDASDALQLARAHWRCENEGHWTADAIWDEDARRTPWTQHPDGVLVVGILRAIAINILAVLRALSRIQEGLKSIKPTWKTTIEQALLVLCEPLLDMEAFNDLEA